jgi:hypothetical protein
MTKFENLPNMFLLFSFPDSLFLIPYFVIPFLLFLISICRINTFQKYCN